MPSAADGKDRPLCHGLLANPWNTGPYRRGPLLVLGTKKRA